MHICRSLKAEARPLCLPSTLGPLTFPTGPQLAGWSSLMLAANTQPTGTPHSGASQTPAWTFCLPDTPAWTWGLRLTSQPRALTGSVLPATGPIYTPFLSVPHLVLPDSLPPHVPLAVHVLPPTPPQYLGSPALHPYGRKSRAGPLLK